MKEKKILPRGYKEILNFIEKIEKRDIKSLFWEKDITLIDVIKDFLEKCYKKRLAVIKSLLYLLEEFQKKENKSKIISLILSLNNISKNNNIDLLINLLKSSNINDNIRKKILLILDKTNNQEKIEELIKYFENKEYIASFALNILLKNIGKNGENLGSIFNYISNQSVEFYQTLTANLISYKNEESIWLLGMLAEFPDDKVAETAIKALGYRKSQLAYEMLDNLITHRETKKELILESMKKLTQAGIKKSQQRILIPHKCYLSWIDGNGEQILVVSRRIGKGRLFLVTFIIHEERGIIDSSVWSNISSFEMKSFIKGLENQVGLKQIDYTYGIKIVEDGLWKIVKNKQLITPSFLSARKIFGNQKLTPKKYNIDLKGLGIEYIKDKFQKLIDNSHTLIKLEPFNEWHINSDKVINFVKTKRSLNNNKKIRKDIINLFINTIIEEKKETLKERLIMTTDFLNKTSPRTYRKQIEIALAIYIGLEKGLSIKKIPFFEELAKKSIEKGIKLFKSQKEDKNKKE